MGSNIIQETHYVYKTSYHTRKSSDNIFKTSNNESASGQVKASLDLKLPVYCIIIKSTTLIKQGLQHNST